MNKKDRVKLAELARQLSDIKDEIETIAGGEQDKFDNMPEGLQQSAAGEEIQNAAEELQSAVDGLDGAINTLEGLA